MSTESDGTLEVIRTKKRRLELLEQQAARLGYSVDPSVTMEIEDLRAEILQLEQKAERAVSALGLPSSLMSTTGAGTDLVASPFAPPAGGGALAPSDQEPGQEIQRPLAQQGPAVVLDPPPIQPWVGRRTETVSGLAAEAQEVTWYSLNGIASRGKTLLTRLLADALGGDLSWVRFEGLSDESAASLLERVCSSLTNQAPPLRRNPWYQAAALTLGSGSVLVLDDLPNLASSPQLVSRLVPFIRACASAGVRVLSSSLFPLPQSVLEELDEIVADEAAPPFTDGDAKEVLTAFGAPAEMVDSTARLINALTRQHPTLLVAACRYMQARNWQLQGDALQGLFQGTYATNLAAEVHQKLLGTVPDETTRQLLYRLTLVAGSFSLEDVDTLAGAPPPITGARERLRDILNSWVEQRPDGQCVVSALVVNMGRDNLSRPERSACHVALGDAVVARGTVNQHQAFLAITNYHMGGEFDKSATMLVMILQEAVEHAEWVQEDALLLLWTRDPLPAEFNLNLRLMVRGLHIALFHKLDRDLGFLFGDFEGLLAEADESHYFGIAGAVSFIAMAIGRRYPLESGRWLRRLLQLSPPPSPAVATGPEEEPGLEPYTPSQELPLFGLIWMLVGELNTVERVNDWLDTFQAMSLEQRNQAIAFDTSYVSCVVVGNSLTGGEQAKPPGERNWPEVAANLTALAARAREMGCEPLWAAFIRSKINVQAEFCRDVDGALATANEASLAVSADPVLRFMIEGAIGRQLALVKRYPEARTWLRRAIEQNAESVFAYERSNVLLGASHAFGVENPALGVQYAAQATDVLESDEQMPMIERVRGWAERGVAEFLATGAADAFSSWERAGDYLFAMTERTDFWKELMVLYGHVSGYLAKVAETGQPPAVTRDGEPYAPPERGVFMTTNAARVAFFDQQNGGSLWRIIAYYAEAVGATELAAKWRERAAAVGRRDSLLVLVAEADREDIPRVLRESGYQEALERGRKAGVAMVVCRTEMEAGRIGRVPDSEMQAAIAQLNDRQKLAAEEFGMVIGLIPCVVWLATRFARGEEQAVLREQAEQLAAACRTVGAGSLSSERWNLMAEMVERAYVRGDSLSQMVEWRRPIEEGQGDCFRILVRLVSCADASPTDAAATMLSFMPRLCGCMPPGTSAHRELLVPFVETYWTHKFAEQRFLFGQAMAVESQLPQAVAAPLDQRVVAIFRVLHTAFRLSEKCPTKCGAGYSGTSEFGKGNEVGDRLVCSSIRGQPLTIGPCL